MMRTHTHPGYPGLRFDDDDCFLCRGEAPTWPPAVLACGCNPVVDCARHRAERRATC